jgi:hypothetical protein
MGPYYSNVGPGYGLVMYRDVVGSIDVFEDFDCSIPIGTARCIGWDAAGSAVWRLVVCDDDSEVPCVIVDREFLSTEPDWRDLYRSDFHPDLDRRGSASWPLGRQRVRRTGRLGTTPALVQPSIL